MPVDWMLTFANHREHFAPAIKDKRIRFASAEDTPHWTELILALDESEED